MRMSGEVCYLTRLEFSLRVVRVVRMVRVVRVRVWSEWSESECG